MAGIIAALQAMSIAEVIAVILGVVYLVLAVRRSRWCWVAGGISSAIVIWLSAQKALPMQAALNVYYVVVSVYGYWRWTDADIAAPGSVAAAAALACHGYAGSGAGECAHRPIPGT